jgi:hypothetical protein
MCGTSAACVPQRLYVSAVKWTLGQPVDCRLYVCVCVSCLPLPADTKPHFKPINWWEYRRKRFEGDYANVGEEVQIEWYRLRSAAGAH